MGIYTQANRPLKVTTPLGPDVLLLTGFSGREAISQLYYFHLELLATNETVVPFERLLGQRIHFAIQLPGARWKHFDGICSRMSQGHRDRNFTTYQMQVVPQLWVLGRRARSRIFQHVTVPDILRVVLADLKTLFQIQGTFEPRDYCVQYRETDLNFASRLMEEEGIFYFFEHSVDGHQMVLANRPEAHLDVPGESRLLFECQKPEASPEAVRVFTWEKSQELRSGKYTLWDFCFEMPDKHLEATAPIQRSVRAGTVEHQLQLGANRDLEVYDYPGAYAQRFDGIDRGGAAHPADLQKIFTDNQRTARIRMEQEACPGLEISGTSNAAQLSAGHRFDLQRHFDADGEYVLVSVEHDARNVGLNYRSSGQTQSFTYNNRFKAIPLGLPYRPPLAAAKPVVQGPQTARVVGPPGEIIYPDPYGRVKVQFPWDRDGLSNLDSSCWVRVSQNWAGAQWGGMFIPHVGHEVIVEFEEGDIDRPLITGRVYNADNMPKRALPDHKTQSVISDHGSNYLIFEGKTGTQNVDLYSPVAHTQITFGAAPADYNHHFPTNLRGFAQPFGVVGNVSDGINITTDHNINTYVGNNHHVAVRADSHLHVGGSVKQEVLRNYHLRLPGGLYSREVTGTDNKKVSGTKEEVVNGLKLEAVNGMKNERVNGIKAEETNGLEIKVFNGVSIELPAEMKKFAGGVFKVGTALSIDMGGGGGGGE